MNDALPWIAPALLGTIFLVVASVNASVIIAAARGKEAERASSMMPVFGGVAGAIALASAPNDTLRSFVWLPLILDVGCVPYLAVVGILSIREGLRSGHWMQHVPFLRYLHKAPPTAREPYPKENAIIGCILGTAVGDAMGLACEGLSRRRQLKMHPELTGYRVLFNKGLTSDDTEHTCMLAQSLIATGNYHPELLERKFCSNFGWRLRFWLLGLPAGIGLATLRAILKLWIGFPARKSGVYSAGNGPAMRIALIGVCYGEDPQKMRTLVRAATRVTHTDPKAEYGALAVALAAHLAATRVTEIAPAQYLQALQRLIGNEPSEFMELMRSVTASVESEEDPVPFAARIGCAQGISGYIYHTVPAALHVWLSHQGDYRSAVLSMIRLGGDTDTTAAIVGAIVGARAGKTGIPAEWLRNLWEWPRTSGWMEQLGITLAARCADGCVSGGVPVSVLKLLVRNILFIVLVLLHGFRRLLPPY